MFVNESTLEADEFCHRLTRSDLIDLKCSLESPIDGLPIEESQNSVVMRAFAHPP